MNTLFVPAEAGPSDPVRRAMLDVLVGEDIETFSARENAVFHRASDHGECYWATITVDAAEERVLAETDLGSPGSGIMLNVPPGFSNKKILEALDAAAQVLMRID